VVPVGRQVLARAIAYGRSVSRAHALAVVAVLLTLAALAACTTVIEVGEGVLQESKVNQHMAHAIQKVSKAAESW
jgi:hypothetical protein